MATALRQRGFTLSRAAPTQRRRGIDSFPAPMGYAAGGHRMVVSRRAALQGALAVSMAGAAARVKGAEPLPVRVGVLRFGTVAWELDVIRRHGFDRAHGIAVAEQAFAAPPATQVALQAGAVDVTAQDWLWVARQRAEGADFAFATFSTAIGAVVAPKTSNVRSVADLPGKRLGIAGSSLDKSWLLLRAYAQRTLGLDLDNAVQKSFGPPPLLAEQAAVGRLDAVLTFWPFVARAEAAGAHRVLAIEDAVRGLGITGEVPVVGYTFSERWAAGGGARGLLAASADARAVLQHDDAEWDAIAPLMGTTDAAERRNLREAYRAGIPHAAEAEHAATAARLFAVLAGIGGAALVGSARTLPPGTFWHAG
jgi:NitT/TauT family transport system substrate-binding protein